MGCGKCHKCGGPIQSVLDGEEWCPVCQCYQRPVTHGWSPAYGDFSLCPQEEPEGNAPSVVIRRLNW
jgi:hypothetical protein